jgi:hypothetical protein
MVFDTPKRLTAAARLHCGQDRLHLDQFERGHG